MAIRTKRVVIRTKDRRIHAQQQPNRTKIISYADFTIGVAYFRSGTLTNGRLRFNLVNLSFNI